MTDPRTALLDAAADKVTGKSDNYDTPERSFGRIAALWNTWLDISNRRHGVTLSEKDVAVMMMLLKMSRLASDPNHYDSVLDLAGYAACYAELIPQPDLIRSREAERRTVAENNKGILRDLLGEKAPFHKLEG